MGKKDVNKPGQFKLAGRLRPGKDSVPDRYKQDYRQEEAREEELSEGVPPGPHVKANRPTLARKSAFGSNVKRGSK